MSKELIEAIESYENYISANGITEEAISAYVLAAETAINKEKDIQYGLKVSGRVKELIEKFVLNATGGSVWELEKYAYANKTWYDILEQYYGILKLEAQNKVVDSGFRYLEKKREPKDRFYMPRREQLLKIGLIDGLQGMIDDKYDILCISLIPGAGKTTIEKFFNALVIG